jgi:hypothetical protein
MTANLFSSQLMLRQRRTGLTGGHTTASLPILLDNTVTSTASAAGADRGAGVNFSTQPRHATDALVFDSQHASTPWLTLSPLFCLSRLMFTALLNRNSCHLAVVGMSFGLVSQPNGPRRIL